MIVGITGGIGSGKTTLCNKLREAGYLVFDTDKVARDLQNHDPEVRQLIVDLFGSRAYVENGLDRAYIASLVFKSPSLLQQLNQIVHPAVRQKFEIWVKNNYLESLLFIESALLFNSDLYKLVDKVVLVIASEATRLKRVCERDGVTEEQVKSRIVNQMSDSEMIKKSDFVIDTDKKQIHELSVSIFIDYVNHFRK